MSMDPIELMKQQFEILKIDFKDAFKDVGGEIGNIYSGLGSLTSAIEGLHARLNYIEQYLNLEEVNGERPTESVEGQDAKSDDV